MLEQLSRGGSPQDAELRRLSSTEIKTYRGEAERRLTLSITSAIDEVTPSIVVTAREGSIADARAALDLAIQAAAERVCDTVRRQTAPRAAIATNLVAWMISLAVTVLIVQAFYLPNWQAALVARLQAAVQGGPPTAKGH